MSLPSFKDRTACIDVGLWEIEDSRQQVPIVGSGHPAPKVLSNR